MPLVRWHRGRADGPVPTMQRRRVDQEGIVSTTVEQGQGELVVVETSVCVDGLCGYEEEVEECSLCGSETPWQCTSCGQFFCSGCVAGVACPACRPEAYEEGTS